MEGEGGRGRRSGRARIVFSPEDKEKDGTTEVAATPIIVQAQSLMKDMLKDASEADRLALELGALKLSSDLEEQMVNHSKRVKALGCSKGMLLLLLLPLLHPLLVLLLLLLPLLLPLPSC